MRFDVHYWTSDPVVRTYNKDLEMGNRDDDKKSRAKVVTRWNVQPLRELEADVYPTPPTESLRANDASARPSQKTRRRRPGRPSKS